MFLIWGILNDSIFNTAEESSYFPACYYSKFPYAIVLKVNVKF